jgi:Histidine phosphatase superfamily (branch 1)
METTRKTGPSLPILVALTLSTILGAIGVRTNAQEAVFLVPKAEGKFGREELTDLGRKKVQALGGMLMDAGIDVIYAIDRVSAVRTAEPIAKALNIKVNTIPYVAAAIDDWTRRLPTEHAKQRVLVATFGAGPMTGEGQRILKGLGVPDKEIWARRLDHLMVILPKGSEEPLVIKMRW